MRFDPSDLKSILIFHDEIEGPYEIGTRLGLHLSEVNAFSWAEFAEISKENKRLYAAASHEMRAIRATDNAHVKTLVREETTASDLEADPNSSKREQVRSIRSNKADELQRTRRSRIDPHAPLSIPTITEAPNLIEAKEDKHLDLLVSMRGKRNA